MVINTSNNLILLLSRDPELINVGVYRVLKRQTSLYLDKEIRCILRGKFKRTKQLCCFQHLLPFFTFYHVLYLVGRNVIINASNWPVVLDSACSANKFTKLKLKIN